MLKAGAFGAWHREVMFTHFIWLSRVLLSTKARSALEVKSRLSRQRILSQLGNAAQYLTHTTYKHCPVVKMEVQL